MMLAPHLTISVFNKPISSFHLFGVIGFIVGSLLGVSLCHYLNLHIGIILLMSLTGAATFFLLAILAKIITGEEVIVYYHHEIAILIMCAVVLHALHQPVLPYLDVTILGIATFLAFGRIGCFNVGCCHGRPVKGGVRYRHEHVEAGFTPYYEDVPLFPVQLVESAFVFIVVIAGSFLLLRSFPAGTVLLLYTVVYGLFRFSIEIFRGDPERPYWRGLSEAQWTTLLLITISLVLSFTGLLPLYTWHVAISALLLLTSGIIILRNNITDKIISPKHIRQIASALSESKIFVVSKRGQKKSNMLINIHQTDLGLCLSKGQVVQDGALINHYTISCKSNIQLSYFLVEKIAKIIQQIQKHKGLYEIFEKESKVFHILFKE